MFFFFFFKLHLDFCLGFGASNHAERNPANKRLWSCFLRWQQHGQQQLKPWLRKVPSGQWRFASRNPNLVLRMDTVLPNTALNQDKTANIMWSNHCATLVFIGKNCLSHPRPLFAFVISADTCFHLFSICCVFLGEATELITANYDQYHLDSRGILSKNQSSQLEFGSARFATKAAQKILYCKLIYSKDPKRIQKVPFHLLVGKFLLLDKPMKTNPSKTHAKHPTSSQQASTPQPSKQSRQQSPLSQEAISQVG